MKKQFCSARLTAAWKIMGCTLLLFSVGAWSTVMAQVTFTRITEGAIVEDRGKFAGADWGDYDNDGYMDVVVSNQQSDMTHLYHNNGDGTFSRVTEGIIATDSGLSTFGPAWADQDNDGDLDLFVATRDRSANVFYRNDGDGTFTKVTEGDWVNTQNSAGFAAWGDYDNDGFVDLYVNIDGNRNFLYHNNGDGTMTPVDTAANAINGGSHGSGWSDYDGDGDVDLFVGGQSQTQFRNDGNGVFTWITASNGGIPSRAASVFMDVALASADYDNDGDLDVLHTTSDEVLLYRNDGKDGFVEATDALVPRVSTFGVGAAWGDYDNDGHQDIFVSNWDGNNLLYHNEGDGSFTQITEGAVVELFRSSGSCSWVDYDNDGDLDLFVSNGMDTDTDQPCELYRNNEEANNWIALNLDGIASNRSAIGAKIRATATIEGQEVTQLREINGGGNGQSQEGPRTHFGLGNATKVDTLRIEWPSGAVQVLGNVSANQFLEIEEEYLGGNVANISTRGQVGTGDDILIAGLVISGNVSQKVLVRASGQTLGGFDVTDVLADTVLTLFTLEGAQIASNTNWGDAANATDIAVAAETVGAFEFPADSTDSAILMTLDAGGYTAQVTGNGGATGNAIVEVYVVE